MLVLTGLILFVILNLYTAVPVGDWLFERISPELSVAGILMYCSPTICIVLGWLA